ncbi:hypothetical protein BJD12_16420 [Xanthomonas vesicatoria ATCC 35937]|nr:hypothetical protein BI313_19350 [Xanthomonas vesicatoria]APP76543.1 hypothetical protein BJD12_16420 [Xanthomonas vesicatoria ATCC 35937]
MCEASILRVGCRARARPPSRDTLQVRPCSSLAASMPQRSRDGKRAKASREGRCACVSAAERRSANQWGVLALSRQFCAHTRRT